MPLELQGELGIQAHGEGDGQGLLHQHACHVTSPRSGHDYQGLRRIHDFT
jgi:hypothetical protein